jgi:hypothetical protein
MSCTTMVPALCQGILCDWQQPLNHLVQCWCMFTSCQAAIILQVHVTFDYIDENRENQTHTWWTTIAHGRWPNFLYLQSLQQLIALHFMPCIRPLESQLLHLCRWWTLTEDGM